MSTNARTFSSRLPGPMRVFGAREWIASTAVIAGALSLMRILSKRRAKRAAESDTSSTLTLTIDLTSPQGTRTSPPVGGSGIATASAAIGVAYPLRHPTSVIPQSFFTSTSSGVLFDLDGTLIESKQIWCDLLNSASISFGYGPIDYDVWEPTYGQSQASNREIFFPRHTQAEVDEYCNEHYIEFISALHVLPGAIATLHAVRSALGTHSMAICTNCPRPITKIIIAAVPELLEFFSDDRIICSGDHVQLDRATIEPHSELSRLSQLPASAAGSFEYKLIAKPDTDIIHFGCHQIGRRAEDCLFIGDSKYDIMSALAAGCFAIGIGEKGRGGHMWVEDVLQLGENVKKQMQDAKQHAKGATQLQSQA
jgi:beta-phosphoglucomutase-like phosphatase (HAD superfamily)